MIYATIPARGGSKGVPKKNIKSLKGYPLIAYSIAAAKLSKSIERVIVSTDSEEIAYIARKFDADVPFLRPAEYAQDDSGDNGHILHLIEWCEQNEGKKPEFLVHLRPTTPLRNSLDIDKAVTKFSSHPKATSIRSAHICPITPFKLALLDENDFFTGFTTKDMEIVNTPRQRFPAVYLPNGYVDVLSVQHAKETGRLHDKVLSFITEVAIDIDTEDDFKQVEKLLENHELFKYLETNYQHLRNNYD